MNNKYKLPIIGWNKRPPWLPEGIAGRCSTCGELVTQGDWDNRTHPCVPLSISYGLGAIINPDNTPWVPGFRFRLKQAAQTSKSGRHHIGQRSYGVVFEIDQDGILQWVGGVYPTDDTMEIAQELYAMGRPGSNYG